jgi:hypothetical protein
MIFFQQHLYNMLKTSKDVTMVKIFVVILLNELKPSLMSL